MRSAIKLLAPVSLAGTILWTATGGMVLASQPSAREKPEASGPLSFEGRSCEKKEERFKDPGTGEKETVAVAQACVMLYVYDPEAERDSARDYGIAWLQTTVDARNGWCATMVKSDLTVTDDARMHEHDPKKTIEPQHKKRVKVSVTTDAKGHGDEIGKLRQSFTLRPRQLKPSLKEKPSANLFRLRWRGSTNKNLAFVSGAEISWDTDDAVDSMTSGLSYEFEKRGKCR